MKLKTKGMMKNKNGVPMYGIQLTKEQYKEVKDRRPEVVDVNGLKYFEVINKQNGSSTGTYMVYVVFM